MNKSERNIQAGLKFFNQIIILLKEFNIETTEAKVYKNVCYVRPSGIRTYRIVFRIKNKIENRKKFYEKIGFIYSKRKQEKLIESLN